MSQRGIELELPDLPEVPIRLGAPEPGPARARVPLMQRLREGLGGALPLLLMGLLALGTWWLVKNSPRPLAPREAAAPRAEPDYAMQEFLVRRFDAQGEQKVRVQGREMRHYESPERVEIDQARVLVRATDGREALLTARRAVSDPRGERVQLLGEAVVTSRAADGQPLRIASESLELDGPRQRLSSRQAVQVESGASTMRAAGMDYDHLRRHLALAGPIRAVYMPEAAR
jgi:lipopolysaccharide export system protein LptC